MTEKEIRKRHYIRQVIIITMYLLEDSNSGMAAKLLVRIAIKRSNSKAK